jgi:hypothetical protein
MNLGFKAFIGYFFAIYLLASFLCQSSDVCYRSVHKAS